MTDDRPQKESPCKFKYLFKKKYRFLGLTSTQLKIITSGKKVDNYKYQVGNKAISKGSYYRVRDQAITNITKSIMTISILISCDIISYDDLVTVITTTSKLLDEDVPIDEIYIKIKNYLKKTVKPGE